VPGPVFSLLADRFEQRMDDRVRITHNPFAQTDSTMDPGTWKPVAPPDETSVIYEGAALLIPQTYSKKEEEGANPLELLYFVLHLPVAAAIPAGGDDALVLACPRDPLVVGKRFTVLKVDLMTYPVSRMLQLQERAAARPHAGRR